MIISKMRFNLNLLESVFLILNLTQLER